MPTPPHLAQPRLTYLEPGQQKAYLQAVSLGFHEEFHDEPDSSALDERLFEPARTFGFQVDDRWVATCGAFSRTMTLPGGRAVPVGAVTVVTVAPGYRRRGLLRQMMRHQLDDIRRRKEPMAILWASESLIYGRFGYGFSAPRARQKGATRSLGFLPNAPVAVGSVDEVTRDQFLAAAEPLHQRLLSQRPGALNRTPDWWEATLQDPEWARHGAGKRRYALHYAEDGTVDGYAAFRIGEDTVGGETWGAVRVTEVDGDGPAPYAALWRFLLDLDLVRSFVRQVAPVDDRLRAIVADPRAIETTLLDGIYVRIIDVVASLAARSYSAPLDLVLELDDAFLPDNSGRYRIQVDDGTARVTRARRKPDISLGIRELGSAYLGGTSVGELHAAGLVTEHTDGAAAAMSTAFGWPTMPFCPDQF